MRKTILLVLAAVMVVVMVLTWGSVGSAVMAFCLLNMGLAMLYQKFLTNQEESDYQMEE